MIVSDSARCHNAGPEFLQVLENHQQDMEVQQQASVSLHSAAQALLLSGKLGAARHRSLKYVADCVLVGPST